LHRFLEVLTSHGRAVPEAYNDYALLMAAVTGGAASAIGRAASIDAGHPTLVDVRRAAKALGRDDATLVQELLRRRRREPDPFEIVRVAIDSIGAEVAAYAATPPDVTPGERERRVAPQRRTTPGGRSSVVTCSPSTLMGTPFTSV
jgi:hypothetical protein